MCAAHACVYMAHGLCPVHARVCLAHARARAAAVGHVLCGQHRPAMRRMQSRSLKAAQGTFTWRLPCGGFTTPAASTSSAHPPQPQHVAAAPPPVPQAHKFRAVCNAQQKEQESYVRKQEQLQEQIEQVHLASYSPCAPSLRIATIQCMLGHMRPLYMCLAMCRQCTPLNTKVQEASGVYTWL